MDALAVCLSGTWFFPEVFGLHLSKKPRFFQKNKNIFLKERKPIIDIV